MDSKSNVPYQTYRSKKHLRSQSSTPTTSAAVTPDLHVDSYFAHVAPTNVPDSGAPQPLEPLVQPKVSEMRATISTSNVRPTDSASGAKSKDELPVVAISVSRESTPETTTPNVVYESGQRLLNGKQQTLEERSSSQSDRSDTKNGKAAPTEDNVISTPSPASIFRRIPSRTRTTSEQHSPLLRTSSAVANSPSFRRVSTGSRLRFSSESSLVPPNSQPVSSNAIPPITAPNVLQPSPLHVVQPTPDLLSTNTLSHAATTQSSSISHSSHPSRPSSTSTSSPSISRRSTSTLPYRPGFQPKGIYRQRTDEFIELRSSMRDKGKVETRRLERRLEKLIQLHFLQETTSEKVPPTPNNRHSISFLDTRNPSEIWKNVIEARMQASKNSIRTEEQYITPWQPDSEVSQCPHCSAFFHPLTNRKHHCRLCGRVVCSLPLKHPVRKQPCSILFVVDQKTSMIEEVGEGVDYGVKRRTTSSNANVNEPEKDKDDEKFLKGVRICRTCRVILRRQQYLQEATRIPPFVGLHDTLVKLEKEIEDALGKFHESVASLSTLDPSSNTPSIHQTSVASLRKRLLESFASYDKLSKRIAQFPAPKGGSQERVQNAVLSRAALFLQSNMFPLQSLPKLQLSPSPSSHELALEEDKRLAETLQPLLEQEALLEGFIEEAKAQRKFEDAKTLKANLEEIRMEIKRVASQAGAS